MVGLIERFGEDLVIVGTAHVSARSVQDVETAIREHKPDRVLIELDKQRLEALQDPERWQKTDIVQVIKDKKQHMFLLQLYLANMQARMGRETGVAPGGEMLRAVEVAQEVGAEVVLIDRDVGLTMRRGFGSMGFRSRFGLLLNILMEMLPNQPASEKKGTPKSRTLRNAAYAGLLALLFIMGPIQDQIRSGWSRLLDALIGYPSFPPVTYALLGLLAGILVATGCRPRQEGPDAAWSPYEGTPWSAVILGLIAVWAHEFLLGAGGVLADDSGQMLLAGGLAAALAVLGWRMTQAIRRFQARRASVTTPDDIDAMLETDAITAMTEEFARFAPIVKHALIDERDAYMASHIAEQRRAGRVVAVVGAGHLPGIQRHLTTGTPLGRDSLDEEPPKRFGIGRAVAWIIPAIILGAFGYLLWQGDYAALGDAILWWIVINGGLSALGAALAGGHPISILTALVAAPITSVNPTLAAGWFAGLAEAKVRTPTVADFQAIPHIESLRGFWRNGVVRILMVTALANVGSTIGTFVAGTKVVQALAGGG